MGGAGGSAAEREGGRAGAGEGGKEGEETAAPAEPPPPPRARRQAGGEGRPVSLARCQGEEGGAPAWGGQWWGWLRGSPWGRGCSRGGCDGLTGA